MDCHDLHKPRPFPDPTPFPPARPIWSTQGWLTNPYILRRVFFPNGQTSKLPAFCEQRATGAPFFLSSSARACESLFHVTRMYSRDFVREIGRAREQIIDPCAILLSLFIQTGEGPITNFIVFFARALHGQGQSACTMPIGDPIPLTLRVNTVHRPRFFFFICHHGNSTSCREPPRACIRQLTFTEHKKASLPATNT